MADRQKVPYYTQAGLADAAGVGRSAVSKAIERGTLKAVPTVDGVPLVPQADAERWITGRPGRGRPPSASKPVKGKRKGAK
jgi:hypothetical protein